jgi:serine/threonine-protein kinase
MHAGRYRITQVIGSGGHGILFLAIHEDTGQRAAVKVAHSGRLGQRHFRSLAREGRAAVVEHPGLARIFDFNQFADGTPYVLMEFLEGETLRQRMQRLLAHGQPVSAADALRLGRQLASALCALHRRGIVHRDLKPDNIMLVKDPDVESGERPKIFDFGIAKFMEGLLAAGKTSEDRYLGTPAYGAPEQCTPGQPVDSKADVYALGMTLFELLGGRLPFLGRDARDFLQMQVSQAPLFLGDLRPDLPPALCTLIMKMLSKTPAERPSMAEVLAHLDGLAGRAKVRRRAPVRILLPVGATAGLLAALAALGVHALVERPRAPVTAKDAMQPVGADLPAPGRKDEPAGTVAPASRDLSPLAATPPAPRRERPARQKPEPQGELDESSVPLVPPAPVQEGPETNSLHEHEDEDR